jgi:hypothetical protein
MPVQSIVSSYPSKHISERWLLFIGHIPRSGIFRLNRCQTSLFKFVSSSVLFPIDKSKNEEIQDGQAKEDSENHFADSIARCRFGLESLRSDPVTCTIGCLLVRDLTRIETDLPMICTALAVAFLVYPTVLALSEAIVRPQPVPAAPMSESKAISR